MSSSSESSGPVESRGLAALALGLIVPAPVVGVVAAMILLPGPGPGGEVVFFICKVWMLALPVVWLRFVDRERFSLSPARRGGFGLALVSGLAIGATIVVAWLVVGHRWVDTAHVREMAARNGIGTPTLYVVAVAYWVLVNSVLEEYVYRWFIFRKCEVLMPGLVAVLTSALFFTVHHVIALRVQFAWNLTILASIGVFLGGAIWSWMYLRYRSVWPGYLSHAIVDIVIFVIGWRIIFG